MISNEIIGIIILASVGFIILVIYLCKCYSDCARSRHKENVKPTNITDQDLVLLSMESRSDPLPYDPYNFDNELASSNHNDMQMVTMSVEKFIRQESFRKSVKSKKIKSNQYKPVLDSKEAAKAPEIHMENDGISNANANPTTFGPKRKIFEQTIDAPVIVHNVVPNHQHVDRNASSHIYAAIEKPKPSSTPAPGMDTPTYFRPVKTSALNAPAVAPPVAPPVAPLHTAVQLDYYETLQHTTATKKPFSDMHQEPDLKPRTFPSFPPIKKIQPPNENGFLPSPSIHDSDQAQPIQDEASMIDAKSSKQQKLKKPAPKKSENVPPNKQDVTEPNIFFVPEDIVSPKSNRRARKNSERTIKTLDDIESAREKPRTPKTPKKNKKGNTKTDDSGTPKTPKKRNKSNNDVEATKPGTTSQPNVPIVQSEMMSPSLGRDTVRKNPYSGLCSPPIPPKPRLNPMLSPSLQHNNNISNSHHVRSSQL